MREEHAFQTAARNEFGDVFKRFAFEFVAAVKPCAELVQVGRTVEIGNAKCSDDGEEHGDDSVDAQQRQHDQQRKRNQ